MNRINELICQREEMERDALKYMRFGNRVLAEHLLDSAKCISFTIQKLILGGEQ